MENLNLPPFYIGQKVVYITGLNLPKNSTWTVIEIEKGECCHRNGWRVNIGKYYEPKFINRQCPVCKAIYKKTDDVRWFNATAFAPIEERFISFAEVIAIESQVTGAN